MKTRIVLVATFFAVFTFLFVGLNAAGAATNVTCPIFGTCDEKGLSVAGFLENRGISFSLVVLSGLIDGTNPCAIALLLVLLGSLLFFVENERKMFRIGFAYIGSIAVTYFLIGVFFAHGIEAILQWDYYATLALGIKYTLVGLVWIAGLINVKDVLQKDEEYTLDVTKHRIYTFFKKFVRIDWVSALGIGALVTVFELPCSLPLYLGSIAVLTKSFGAATTVWYLLLYVAMFIAPLVVLFAVIVKSRQLFVALHGHRQYKRLMKAVMALAQIVIGIGILFL